MFIHADRASVYQSIKKDRGSGRIEKITLLLCQKKGASAGQCLDKASFWKVQEVLLWKIGL